jgi:hypothetical protein
MNVDCFEDRGTKFCATKGTYQEQDIKVAMLDIQCQKV